MYRQLRYQRTCATYQAQPVRTDRHPYLCLATWLCLIFMKPKEASLIDHLHSTIISEEPNDEPITCSLLIKYELRQVAYTYAHPAIVHVRLEI